MVRQTITIKKRPARASGVGREAVITIDMETVTSHVDLAVPADAASDSAAEIDLAIPGRAASARLVLALVANARAAPARAASARLDVLVVRGFDRLIVPNVYHGTIQDKVLLIRAFDLLSEVSEAYELVKVGGSST